MNCGATVRADVTSWRRPRGRSARARGPALSSRVRIPAATPREVRCSTQTRRPPQKSYAVWKESSSFCRAKSGSGGPIVRGPGTIRRAPRTSGDTVSPGRRHDREGGRARLPAARSHPARRVSSLQEWGLAPRGAPPGSGSRRPVSLGTGHARASTPSSKRRESRLAPPDRTRATSSSRAGGEVRGLRQRSRRTDQLRVPGSAHQARQLQFLGDARGDPADRETVDGDGRRQAEGSPGQRAGTESAPGRRPGAGSQGDPADAVPCGGPGSGPARRLARVAGTSERGRAVPFR